MLLRSYKTLSPRALLVPVKSTSYPDNPSISAVLLTIPLVALVITALFIYNHSFPLRTKPQK